MRTFTVDRKTAAIIKSELIIDVSRDLSNNQILNSFQLPDSTLVWFLPNLNEGEPVTVKTYIHNLGGWPRKSPIIETYSEVTVNHEPETLQAHGTATLTFTFYPSELKERYGSDLIPFTLDYEKPHILIVPSELEEAQEERRKKEVEEIELRARKRKSDFVEICEKEHEKLDKLHDDQLKRMWEKQGFKVVPVSEVKVDGATRKYKGRSVVASSTACDPGFIAVKLEEKKPKRLHKKKRGERIRDSDSHVVRITHKEVKKI